MGVWDPTGSQIAYSSGRVGNLEAWVSSSDGTGEARQVTTLGGQVHVDSWSPDGQLIALHRHAPEDGVSSIFMVPVNGPDRTPRPFTDGRAPSEGANFSGDMRYVAYLAIESGQREIYVRPHQGPGGQVTVSVGGGREPRWAANGEIFYRNENGDRMFGVPAPTAPTLKVGTPVALFQGQFYIAPTGSPRPQYDVTADGQRFLMLAPLPGESLTDQSRIVVVQNWFEELKRLVPVN